MEAEDTPLSRRQFNELVKKVTVEVINEIGAKPQSVRRDAALSNSDEGTGEYADPVEGRDQRRRGTA